MLRKYILGYPKGRRDEGTLGTKVRVVKREGEL